MLCTHPTVTTRSTRGFRGPVSRDENRAAHGGVEVEVECAECGARRTENINGCHAEVSAWGPTRDERAVALDTARARLARVRRELPGPRVVSVGATRATVTIDKYSGDLLVYPPYAQEVAEQICSAARLAPDALILRAALRAVEVADY